MIAPLPTIERRLDPPRELPSLPRTVAETHDAWQVRQLRQEAGEIAEELAKTLACSQGMSEVWQRVGAAETGIRSAMVRLMKIEEEGEGDA